MELNTVSFEQHVASEHSSLSDEVRQLFERKHRLRGGESFLDFECPSCKAPVMIVFTMGSQYAMGCFTHRITEIIEPRHWPPTR